MFAAIYRIKPHFEVEDWHTYFVSENNVLVHNTCAVNLPAWKKIQIDMEKRRTQNLSAAISHAAARSRTRIAERIAG